MGLLKRLKFWRKRRQVKAADFEKYICTHIEELHHRLQIIEATQAAMEEKQKERNIESEKVEANLRGQISELEVKLEESDRKKEEMEATLPGQISDLESKLEESERNKKELEATLRGEISELEVNLKKVTKRKRKWMPPSVAYVRFQTKV
jgi:hypothetical protein